VIAYVISTVQSLTCRHPQWRVRSGR